MCIPDQRGCRRVHHRTESSVTYLRIRIDIEFDKRYCFYTADVSNVPQDNLAAFREFGRTPRTWRSHCMAYPFRREYSAGTIYQLPVVLPPKLGDLVVICMASICISITLKRAMRWRFSRGSWMKSRVEGCDAAFEGVYV
jgi:hypothetical protein